MASAKLIHKLLLFIHIHESHILKRIVHLANVTGNYTNIEI